MTFSRVIGAGLADGAVGRRSTPTSIAMTPSTSPVSSEPRNRYTIRNAEEVVVAGLRYEPRCFRKKAIVSGHPARLASEFAAPRALSACARRNPCPAPANTCDS